MYRLFLIFVMLLASCGVLRHYRKVATDTDVTPEKKAIIAPWVSAHFNPQVVYLQGEEVVVLDSTFNQALIDSLIATVDSLTSSTEPKINVDSLKEVIRKECVPRIVYKTRVRVDTIKIRDEALVFSLARDLEKANGQNASLSVQLKETEEKLKKASKKGGTYILYIIAAAVLVAFQGYLLVKKPKL